MLIIGEKINSSLKGINEALISRDEQYILELANAQISSGAHYLDVNAAVREEMEIEDLVWLVKLIQANFDIPLCIDSPNPVVIEAALSVHKGHAIVNSVTGERERLEAILPLVKKYDSRIVALAHDKGGISKNPVERLEVAQYIVKVATEEYGISRENIYIDPLVIPISTDSSQGAACLETIRLIKESIPEVKTVSGLSNVSYGLPNRRYINHVFLILAMQMGLDAAILNPLDKKLMSNIKVSEVVLGLDRDCRGYLTAHRKGHLQFVD